MAKKPNHINKFAAEVTRQEAGRSHARMGDVAQVLKIANALLGGRLYSVIREHYDVPEKIEHNENDIP